MDEEEGREERHGRKRLKQSTLRGFETGVAGVIGGCREEADWLPSAGVSVTLAELH